MTRRRRIERLEVLRRQLAGEVGPVQFWVLSGDGFARYGDLAIREREFMEHYGPHRAFMLRLGDTELSGDA